MKNSAITPEDVRQACNEFCELFPEAEGEQAHIVLSDYNLEYIWLGSCIRGCLKELLGRKDSDLAGRMRSVETIDFLSCLLELSDEERIEADDGIIDEY